MEVFKGRIVIKMKTCTGCNKSKELTEFGKDAKRRDGLKYRCKVCISARNKQLYELNREKIKAKIKKWKRNNREKVNATTRKWNKNNPDKVRARNREYHQRPEVKKRKNAQRKKRYHSDPQFKLRMNLSSRLRKALKGKSKSASTMSLLGCSAKHANDHLEKQFQPGMTWENQGKWHVDHMMPCASFDMDDPEQQRQCCHYTNLQPLWGSENISKGDKIIYNREWNGTRWINKA